MLHDQIYSVLIISVKVKLARPGLHWELLMFNADFSLDLTATTLQPNVAQHVYSLLSTEVEQSALVIRVLPLPGVVDVHRFWCSSEQRNRMTGK